jgi:hypothetical protein
MASGVDRLDWFPEESYWWGMDEASSGTREDYCGDIRDINSDSPITQPWLKIVEL